MTRPATKGVLFDLDGTLYATPSHLKARITWRTWRDVAILRHVTAARDAIRGDEFEDGTALKRAFFHELSQRSGRPADACRSFYEHRFLTAFVDVLATRARARTGLIEVLARLHDANVGLAVVSDYGAIPERLRALDIDPDVFGALVAAEDTGALKPSPRPFEAAADALGLPAAALLVVGDRPDMDEAAANAAGMHFLGIADLAHADYPEWASSAARLATLAAEALDS